MLRSGLKIAIALALLSATRAPATAQQGRIGADVATTPVGVHTQASRRVSCICPPVKAAALGVDVWGTDVYHSDSPICIAAIHAGVLKVEQPGVVTIVLSAGRDSFPGSRKNGVTTKSYGPNATSYAFDRTGNPGQIDWSTTGMGIPETFTASIPVMCPGGGGAMTFQIWGSDVYHEESSICIAAVHAGLISRVNGGSFFVKGDNGKNTYPAVDRNGVLSTVWGGNSPGFRVSASSTALIATQATTVTPGTTATPTGPRQPSSRATLKSTVCMPAQTLPGPAPLGIGTMGAISPAGLDMGWVAVPDAAGYAVERAPDAGGTPVSIATTCDNPSAFKTDQNLITFSDRTGGVEPKTTYVYIVRAFGSSGQMGWNSVRWTSPTPPSPVVQAQPSGSTVNVNWSVPAIDPVTGQRVASPDSFAVMSEYGYTVTLPGSASTHAVIGVPLGTHTFKVEARWAPDVKTGAVADVKIAP